MKYVELLQPLINYDTDWKPLTANGNWSVTQKLLHLRN